LNGKKRRPFRKTRQRHFLFCAENDSLTVFPKTTQSHGQPGAPQTFRSWRTVIEEGAAGESMFVMLRGAANVFVSKNGSKIQVATWGRGLFRRNVAAHWRTAQRHRPRRRRLLRHGNRKTGDGQSAKRRPNCMEQLSQLLAQRKMETEGILKEATSPGRACINRTPIHGQLPAPAPDVFPTLRFRFGRTV
jgi:hypothetical protein